MEADVSRFGGQTGNLVYKLVSRGDGLSDYDEVTTHGTNPALADSDGDMVPDAAELAASTSPLDKNAFLRPRMERGAGGQPELLWQGVSGRTYSVVRSLDLSGTAFDFIRTEVPGAGVDCTVADSDTVVNPKAFYWLLPE